MTATSTQDRVGMIDAQLERARRLPTVERVLARQKKTIEEAQRRHATGTMSWSTDTPARAPLVPMIVERATGCMLYDLDGNDYVDLHLGFWTGLLGHSPPVVVEAVQRELANGTTIGVGHRLESELCEILAKHIACAEISCLANSGTEALMHAVKLARALRRRPTVAKFAQHYHGHYDHFLVDLPEFGLGLPDTDHTLVLPRSVEAFETIRAKAETLACVVIEPAAPGRDIRAAYDLSFFTELRRLTTELGIVLVFDEVFHGFRSSFGARLDKHGVVPDIACFGKIIGGGFPVAAVVGRRAVMELGRTTGNAARDMQTRVPLMGTFPGNRIGCAAGIAQLRYLEAHQHEVYPYMNEQARLLAPIIDRHAVANGLPITATVIEGGLLFVHRRGDADPKAWVAPGLPLDPMVLLQTYLRAHGVYFFGAPVQISPAHRPEHIERIGAAFEAAMRDLASDRAGRAVD